MSAEPLHARRLRRIKWGVIGLAASFLLVVEAFYYFVRGVPLIENIVDWVMGMAGAVVLIEIAFRLVGNFRFASNRRSPATTRPLLCMAGPCWKSRWT